jgi:hypothetical protein
MKTERVLIRADAQHRLAADINGEGVTSIRR